MKARGKLLRVPNAGPGLIMIQGQQFWFSGEATWKSEVVPKPGLEVNVDLDRNLQVMAVSPVPEGQLVDQSEAGAKAAASHDVRADSSLVIWLKKLLRRGYPEKAE
jgi:hypothetical protein